MKEQACETASRACGGEERMWPRDGQAGNASGVPISWIKGFRLHTEGPGALFFFFHLKNVIDSCIVVRKNTERCLVHFAQFPPTVTFCKTIAQYYNQGIDIDPILFRFSQFYLYVHAPALIKFRAILSPV